MSAGNVQRTWWPPAGPADGRPAAGGQRRVPRTVAELCEQFAAVCESAVDPLEIASALEFEGLGDRAAERRYGHSDVFALAREMYLRVPRRPADPGLPADPWQGASGLRPVLHGLLYALPGVCFPAAAGLLIGHGVEVTLIVALLAAWSIGQGLAYIGYSRLGRTTDLDQARRVLRVALLAGLAVVAAVLAATGLVVHAPPSAQLFGLGEGAYMLGAGTLMVLGAEAWLLVALAPGVLYSAAFLALGRPADLQHVAWATIAATPLLALALAAIFTQPARPAGGRPPELAEWIGTLPAAGFGLVAAGLLIFPVAAGPHGHGGINVAALLAALPLSLSMGAAEVSLLWYRRRTRRLMQTTRDIGRFGLGARLILMAAAAQYVAAAATLTAVTVVIAGTAGLVHWRPGYLPQLVAYGALGAAMFLALTLQALGVRFFPLAACGVALAAEIALRGHGVAAQIAVCGGLFAVLGSCALVVLGRTVRHA